jgi:hypothetical protein
MDIEGAMWAPYTVACFFIPDFEPDDVGMSVTIAGVDPAGYNGTFDVQTKGPGCVRVFIPDDPGTYVSGGTIV